MRVLISLLAGMFSTYRTATVRLLRLATNGFIENLQLIIRTIHEFAPSATRLSEQEPVGVDEAVQDGIQV
jgi:hypothetical protein